MGHLLLSTKTEAFADFFFKNLGTNPRLGERIENAHMIQYENGSLCRKEYYLDLDITIGYYLATRRKISRDFFEKKISAKFSSNSSRKKGNSIEHSIEPVSC
jgi:hypothetical protein